MKKLIALLLCLSLVLSLAACAAEPAPTEAPTAAPTAAPTTPPTEAPTAAPTEPPMTADTLYANIKTAMANTVATRASVDLSFNISYTEGGGEDAVTTEVDYKMIVDGIISSDPFGNYALTSIAVGTDGFAMDLTVEMFLVEEEGQVVLYSQTFGIWSRTESGMTAEEYLNSGEDTGVSTENVWSEDTILSDLQLDEGTTMLDGTEVYVLHASIRAEGSAEALLEMGVELEDVGDLKMPVTYYVDAENFTILRMEAEMGVMRDLLAAAMADDLIGAGADPDDLDINFPDAVYTVGYGPQEVPAVPQEAFDYLENGESSSGGGEEEEDPYAEPIPELPYVGEATYMGDGIYVLDCESDAFTLTTPAGWSGMVFSENNVYFQDDDYNNSLDFYYYSNDYHTEDDFYSSVQFDIDSLTENDMFISSGDGPAMEGYTTKQIIGDGISYCYAWTTLEDGYLLIIAVSFDAEPDFEALLPEAVGMIAPYTGAFMEREEIQYEPILQCGDLQLLLAVPEDYLMAYYAPENIMFYTEDFSVCGDFYYFTEYSREDALDNAGSMADYMDSEATLVSQGDGPVMEGYETWKVIGTERCYYYAWREIGDGWLLVYVSDFTGSGDQAEALLNFFLDCIPAE